tara:strand:+ start:33860 stop:34378 length:519 start_codon:yes stop_codon:yes gene_type:complete
VSRDLQKATFDNASGAVTEPLLLVLWEHSGMEESLSCTVPVTLAGRNYAATGIEVSGLSVGESATVVVPVTAARITEVNNGTYRNRPCKIYSIAANPALDDDFDLLDAVLALDGIISASEFTGSEIRASIVHKSAVGNLTPRNTISEIANHIPPAGTVLVSTKQNTELEKSR